MLGREEAGNKAGEEGGGAEVWGLPGLAVESRLPFRAPERSALCVCVCVCVCVYWNREGVCVCV